MNEYEGVLNAARRTNDEVCAAFRVGSQGLFTSYDFPLLLKRSIAHNAVSRDTRILWNEPVEILREYRTWVINGEVSAVVGYKNHNKVKPWEVSDFEKAPIVEFAKAKAVKLKELEAFVMDVGITEDGPKIVEINDVHASGFYRTEHVIDIVADLSSYIKETTPRS